MFIGILAKILSMPNRTALFISKNLVFREYKMCRFVLVLYFNFHTFIFTLVCKWRWGTLLPLEVRGKLSRVSFFLPQRIPYLELRL